MGKNKKTTTLPYLFELHVEVIGFSPSIWRRVLVNGRRSLYHFHDVLQVVFDWEDCHLHLFRVGEVEYAPKERDLDRTQPSQRMTLQRAFIENEEIFYCYDFGDSWEVSIKKTNALETTTAVVPSCLDGKRSGPPEDCGGVYGYANMLDALREPEHPEYDHYCAWLGEDFDPEEFDIDRINRRLAYLAPDPQKKHKRGGRSWAR